MKKKIVFIMLVLTLVINAVGVYGQSGLNDPRQLLNAGAEAYNDEEFEEAIYWFDKAIKLKSDYDDAYWCRGRAYTALGKYDNAIADYNRAIQINPRNAGYYASRGAAYQYKKDNTRAIADANAALKIDPNNRLAKAILSDLNASTSNTQQQQTAPAQPTQSISGNLSLSYTSTTPKVGQTLTVGTDSVGGQGALTIRWLRDNVEISGATSSTYTMTNADVGKKITARVTRAGYSGELTQTMTYAVLPANAPSLTGKATIIGSLEAGKTVTADTSGLSGTGQFRYQWLRKGTGFSYTYITGATNSSYTVTSADVQAGELKVNIVREGNYGLSEAFLRPGSEFEMNGTTLVKYNGNATNVTIPNNVRVIGKEAFAESGVSNLIIPSGVTTIEGGAFFMSDLSSISIPASVTSIDIDRVPFNHCTRLTSITVDAQNRNYSSVDGVLFSKDKKTLIQYPAGKNSSSYTIPAGVTAIWGQAFCYSGRLTSVTIPSSVTSIEDYAFGECNSLTSVTLSRNTRLGDDVFPSGAKLTYSDPAPAPAPAPTQPAPANTASAGPNFIPLSAWKPSDGESPGVTKKGSVGREEGRDVLTMEVTFPSQTASGGGKWGAFTINDEYNLSKIRTATGVRFKAMGDGKRWIIQFHTKESMTDWGSYEAEIKTIPNRVVEINIPYSSLAQPSWGKTVPFVKSNIMSVNLQRMTDSASETGASTLKVFDFEVYSDSSSTASAPVAAPSAKPDEIITSYAGWEVNKDNVSSASVNVVKEQINGGEWNVLNININLAKGDNKWAGAMNWNGNTAQKLRNAKGVRFKVQGDGKKWIVYFATSDVKDDAYHRVIISTQNGKVSNIDIPFNTLKQPDWKKKAVAFTSGNISGMAIERNPELGTGAAVIKVFNFEVY